MTSIRYLAKAIGDNPQRLLTVVLFMAVYGYFAVQFPVFSSLRSTFSILEGLAVIGLVTLGLTVTIVAGEIDLSIGSVAALIGVIVVQAMAELGPLPAIVLGIGCALGIGVAQGYLVVRLGIQAIVLTIGTLVLFRGMSLVLAGEKTVALKDFATSDLLQTRMLIFSPASFLAILIFVLVGAFLKFHRYGREIYAIGGARREALAAGVPLLRPMTITFAISGFCGGLAGTIIALRSGSAQPLGLQDLLLSGVTAAFVGGVHVLGGRGSAIGAAIGALIIQVLTSGMNFFFAPAYVVGLVLGFLLMVVVAFQLAGDRLEQSRHRRDRLASVTSQRSGPARATLQPTSNENGTKAMQDDNGDVLRGPVPDSAAYERIGHLIGGEWCFGASGSEHAVINPANGEVIDRYLGAGPAEVDAAAEAAGRALAAWSRTSAAERGAVLSAAAQLMRDRVERIALNLTLEQGKPLRQARDEVLSSADVMSWFAEQGKRAYGRIVPSRDARIAQRVDVQAIGAVAVLTPWNSPLGTSVRTVAAALAAGCTAVLKPASETPASVIGFVLSLVDAGLPAGVLNLVLGRPADISQRLIAHSVIRKISFTGSVPVGRMLARQAGEVLKPMTLELGGHAPVVVFDDVDMAWVAKEAAAAKFENAGQICISPSRFFVQRRAYSDFLDAMTAEVDCLRVGEGWVDGVDMGPLANSRRLDEVDRLSKDAAARGAKVIRGGRRVGNRGSFYLPTLISDAPDDSAVANEEPFGPILAVVPFDTEEEAISRSNALPVGLAGYAFSSNTDRLNRIAAELEVGMVGLNNFAISRPELPFTGIKDSGYGYACGEEGLDDFTIHRTLTVNSIPSIASLVSGKS